MQPTASGMTENSIEGREATEQFRHYPRQRGRICDVSREINIRRGRNLPVTQSLAGSVFGLDVEQDEGCSRLDQFADHGFGDRAQCAGDEDRFAGQVDGYHYVVNIMGLKISS